MRKAIKKLAHLEPQEVFSYFEDICAIPHGSYATTAISNYLVDFAKTHGLAYRQDEAENVIIWKKGTPGYENSPTVMIQGHIDMVCEKEASCHKDMKKEGLDLFIDGDLLGAKGTTLGGDDGIAVAIALAILDSDTIPHAPLECVFTTNEEVGLLGAQALDASDLTARYMLNIDSEVEKILTVSCAGSARVVATIPTERQPFDGIACEIVLGGMIGGHSGEEIDKGRANANLMLGRTLAALQAATDMRLVSLQGGAKDNAIPREATAVVVVKDINAAIQTIDKMSEALQFEYSTADHDIFAVLRPALAQDVPMDKESTRRIICFLLCVPNGVQNMSVDVPGLVQTSVNLGQVYMEGNNVAFSFMPRSSVDSQKEEVMMKIVTLCRALGGSVSVNSSYAAWQYRQKSKLRDTMIEAFRNVYGEDPGIAALHAGLECGIISGKMTDLDCISFGPDLTDIHTPRERLHIASTLRTWRLTLEILKLLK